MTFDRLFIVDAVGYLFRSYYAIGPMLNEQGQSTSALFGFIRSIQKLLKDFSPHYLVAVFDGPDNKKSRRSVYADYKMHRKGAPEDLYPQFEWAFEFCKLAGIPTLCIDGIEADDTMAAVARFAERQGANVFICSGDKDLMQLVNDHIQLLHTHKENLLINAAKVEELFGVRPDQMLDLLAMMGDSSDNIPGLPGFGPKTAAALLKEFGTLDALLAHPEAVKGEKKQEILRQEQATALMSRELATLDTSTPIPTDTSFYLLQEIKREALLHFYHTMHFNSLYRELEQSGPSSEQRPAPLPLDRQDYRLVETKDALERLRELLILEEEICIDTETTSERPLEAELVGVGLGVKPGIAFYLPCNGALGKDLILSFLKELFAQKKVSFYGHNVKYDWHVLLNDGIEIPRLSFDTILASYLLQPQNRRHNLDQLCLDQWKKVKIPFSSLIGKGKAEVSLRQVPIPAVQEYCCEDVDYTVRLKLLFTQQLEERGLTTLYETLELPLLVILAKMERQGIYLDREQLERCGQELAQELHRLKKHIFTLVGTQFNLNSPLQLSKLLYETLGLQIPGRKRTATSTSADLLEQLRDQHPVVSFILEYRTLEKLRSTYIESLPKEIHPKTKRIHCTFNQSVAATGRLSCQNPNLQNIPVRGGWGKKIRSCFRVEKEGWSYLSADYSQIELRLLAHFSGDPHLVRAFQEGEDIHSHTASLVFGVPLPEVTSSMRAQAKAVNFGILYGQGAYGLSQQTNLSFQEASLFIKTYFERYPRIVEYIESCKAEAKEKGYAVTLLGRQRPIPEMTNRNPAIRSAAERLAVNTPLQGTAADLIKGAMIAIDRIIRKEKLQGAMMLQIHDELVFEVPDAEVAHFKKFVKQEMEQVASLRVPIEVSLSLGKNWGEC